jgi:hypothetical protein
MVLLKGEGHASEGSARFASLFGSFSGDTTSYSRTIFFIDAFANVIRKVSIRNLWSFGIFQICFSFAAHMKPTASLRRSNYLLSGGVIFLDLHFLNKDSLLPSIRQVKTAQGASAQ